MTNDRTCNKCGWVHHGIPTAKVISDIYEFVQVYSELTDAEQERYYNSEIPSVHDFTRCKMCANIFTDFRESKEEDCPAGATLPAILI